MLVRDPMMGPAPMTSAAIPIGANVIFVDGECVFCHRIVSFILTHDRRGIFHFGQLQGPLAKDVLTRYGRNANDVDSVYILTDAGTPDEQLRWDGKASRAIWPRLFWFAFVLRWIPLPILDFGYQAFAKRRYRFFGKYDACHVPSPEERKRFLDLGAGAVA
jgi:predicted DCC family thiol-disulfide oxidoreductase YuxK